MALTDKLEAVNRCLFTINQRPLDSLEGVLNTDHVAAIRAVDQSTREFLMEGWGFNTDRDITLEQDGNGEIALPNTAIDWQVDTNYGQTDPRDYTIRSGKLYKPKEQSSVFTAGVKFKKIIHEVDFDNIPPIAREYLAIKASRVFAFNRLRDQALQIPSLEERSFRAQWMRSQLRDTRPSMMRDPNIREAAGEMY